MDFVITVLLWGFAALCALILLANMLLILPRLIAFSTALFLLGLPVYLYIKTSWLAALPCALLCWPAACKILFFMTGSDQIPYQDKGTKED